MKDGTVSRKQAWIVCISCSMIFSAFFGFFNNCTALLLSAIADDTGLSNSQIAVYSTVKTIAFAMFISLTGKLYSGKNGKKWLLLSGVVCILSFLAMPFFTALWQLYVTAALVGGFSSGAIILSSLVLPNWFDRDIGKAISIGVAPAGLVGMLANPLLSRIISALGWRYACVILCLPVALLFFPAVLFMYKPAPDGAIEEKAGSLEKQTSLSSDKKLLGKGTAVLALCVLAVAGGTYYNKMQDFMVQVASVSGYNLSVRAIVASCLMFGNVFFKSVSGILVDHFGVFRSFKLWYALILCSIIFMLIPVQSTFLMCAAAFLFSSSFGLNLIGLPSLLRQFYSGEEYTDKMRFLSSFNYYVSATLAFLVGKVLDMDNGVRLLFSFWLVLALVSFCAIPFLKKKVQLKADK